MGQTVSRVWRESVHRIRNGSQWRADCRQCEWTCRARWSARRCAEHTNGTGHTTRLVCQTITIYAKVAEEVT